ncbi:MAG: hypothetical protein HRU04_07180 [Oceanospirillaceae bacterium]|nr:hypothetical protein [Oceanospirillaceae bacterium]
MFEEAKKFFNAYNTIFDSGDMAAFSQLFAEPFISVRPDSAIASMSTNEIALNFFTDVLNTWKLEGYKYFSTKDYDVTPIGKKSMLVTLTWEMLNENHGLIREWRQSYNLLMVGNQWKVITSTFHTR